MTDQDAEFDTILEACEAAGLVEVYEEDGQRIMRLTPAGEKVASQLALAEEKGQEPTLEQLLGALET